MFSYARKSDFIHLEDIRPSSGLSAAYKRFRNRKAHWVAECLAEAFGTALFCYGGGSAQAGFIIGNILGIPGFGSLLAIGIGYGIGLALAFVTCAETSGGHFHPGLTISYITFKGFPFWKGMRYIVAQIVGAYLAFAFIYIQWRPSILEAEEHLKAKGMYETSMFTPHGPAGIFAPYAPAGYSMGTLFLNEFVVDFVIGVVVFCIHDPTTIRVNPALLPWIAAFTACMLVQGFAPNGIAIDPARDIGGRLVAMSIWGTQAAGNNYSAIAALTAFPASLLGAAFYLGVLGDSERVVNPAWKFHFDSKAARNLRAKGDYMDSETDIGTPASGEAPTPIDAEKA